MATRIVPLGDVVVIHRLDGETVSRGGIVLPDSAKEKPSRGRIVAVSAKAAAEGFKPGQDVLFPRYGGADFQVDGVDIVITKFSDLLIRFETEPDPAAEPAPEAATASASP